MAYERLITRNEDGSFLIDGVLLDTMSGGQLLLALGKVISRLNEVEDKIEKGDLVDVKNQINYEMF
jgi:hypothetical protein